MPHLVRQYGNFAESTYTPSRYHRSVFPVRRKSEPVRGRGGRRADSVRRSKQIVVRRIFAATGQYGVPLFITLTYEKEPSCEQASRDLSAFWERLRKALPAFICGLAVPEYGKRKGRLHFHAVLYGLPLSMGDIRTGKVLVFMGSERSNRLLAGLWGHGFVDCLQTDTDPRFVWHFAKYITKCSNIAAMDGMRLIQCTTGFPRDVILRGDAAESVIRSLNVEPSWEWTGYVAGVGRIRKAIYTI